MSKIVVAVDDSAGAPDAIALARELARVTGAALELVNVFPYDEVLSRAANREFEEYLRADAREMVERARDTAGLGPDVEIRTIPSTSPAHALHELADAERAGLIVVGSTHTGHLGRVLPGSTGERLLHGAPCPIAVAPRGYAERPAHELAMLGCAYDGSRTSEIALAAAQGFARAAGARLTALRVFQPVAFDAPPAAAAMGPSNYNDALRDRAATELDDAVSRLNGERTEAELRVGNAARELIEASKGFDLLFVGSRGYGPLHAVLVGGVSGRLVREAHCPVVVFPRGLEPPERSAFAGEASVA